ncbi:MAG TPA: prolipoprotein diacylglyceryl transferase family protein [Bryobacteraceae bacterium]|nr:prolipoprotein diacylglyceryl transferase family protein [Bryobacteraceae bacterium]
MIPYYPQPVLRAGPFTIHAFGVLAAAAVVVGGRAILIRAHRKGIPPEEMFRFCFWVYAAAMVGAVLAKVVMDDFPAVFVHPSRLLHAHWGVRSAGGIAGGFLGGLIWCVSRRLSLYEALRRLDIVAYATPLAWMIGRLGCTLAHDHRGLPSDSWLAVQFPEGPRCDLGLIEFLFLIAMVIAFRLLDRQPRPVGFFFGLYGVVYGGFRIWLDTLHLQPMRFYGGAAGVLVGLLGWMAMRAFERSRVAPSRAAQRG